MAATSRRRANGSRTALGPRRVWLALAFAATLLSLPAVALAQSPSPSVLPGGDTRSDGQGPGLSASPLVVAAGVVAIGVAAAGATLLYLRLKRED